MALVVQKCPSHTGEAKNPIAAQPMRLGISAVPTWLWSPREFLESCWSSVYTGTLKMVVPMAVKDSLSNSVDELASDCEVKQVAAKLPSSTSFVLDCHQKVTPGLRVGLRASDTLPGKTPHNSSQQFMSFVIPDVVKLITKISHGTMKLSTCRKLPAPAFLEGWWWM